MSFNLSLDLSALPPGIGGQAAGDSMNHPALGESLKE
jgi:hypothetical protein